jgi:hypothetical protein
MQHPQVLLIGLGGVGSYVLEFLARTEAMSYIVAADYAAEWGQRKVDSVQSGAALQGFYPRLEFRRLDLGDIQSTAHVIEELQPGLILNCATAQTWWVRHHYLSAAQADRLGQAGAGPWLPTHLALARKLMLAIRTAGWQGHVINSGFADASNAVLARQGMAPTMGLGNIDLVTPGVQVAAARRLGVPTGEVRVYAVLHHYHLTCFRDSPTGAPPYYLRILLDDRDVTDRFDTGQLLYEVRQRGVSGRHLDPVVAASGVKNALALLLDLDQLTHTNGPAGLPGGYPVRVAAAGAEVVLPPGLSMEQAIGINEQAQRGDGIECIEEDGTVVFTQRAVRIMREVLDVDLKPLHFGDLDARSDELIARFRALAEG